MTRASLPAAWQAMAMTRNGWWHIFFGATMVVLVFVSLSSHHPGSASQTVGLITIAAVSACYIAFGRRGFHNERIGAAFTVVLILAAGVLPATNANLAIVQCIAFPVIWSQLTSKWMSVVATFVVTVLTGVGFVIALGPTADVIYQAVAIEGITLVGTVALGIWISRIADLSHERQLLLEQLTAAQSELAALSRDAGVVSERERLAREIHDTVAQSLTGIVMLSQNAQRELTAGNLEPLAERLGMLEESARDALVETRSLVAATAPVELSAGIGAALERLAERFTRETSIVVSVEADAATVVDRDTEVVLLRIAQEGLANVRKHSRASAAAITLARSERGAVLTVHDNGRGFSVTAPQAGFGLAGVRDRLALVDGSLDVQSAPGAGTTLTATLPIGVSA